MLVNYVYIYFGKISTQIVLVQLLCRVHGGLCDPMDCSTPDFTVLHYLLELAQTPLTR